MYHNDIRKVIRETFVLQAAGKEMPNNMYDRTFMCNDCIHAWDTNSSEFLIRNLFLEIHAYIMQPVISDLNFRLKTSTVEIIR